MHGKIDKQDEMEIIKMKTKIEDVINKRKRRLRVKIVSKLC